MHRPGHGAARVPLRPRIPLDQQHRGIPGHSPRPRPHGAARRAARGLFGFTHGDELGAEEDGQHQAHRRQGQPAGVGADTTRRNMAAHPQRPHRDTQMADRDMGRDSRRLRQEMTHFRSVRNSKRWIPPQKRRNAA